MPNVMDTRLGLALHFAFLTFVAGLYVGRAHTEKRYKVGQPQDRDWNGMLVSLLIAGVVTFWERAQMLGWVSFGPHGRPLLGLLLLLPPVACCLCFVGRMLYQVGVFNSSDRAA